jgi:hypothetical protein
MIARILSHMDNTLQRLFRYKAWANDELLTALAKLGGESPITKLAIKALSHSHVVDQIFAAHLRGKGHAYASANLSEPPTLEDLSADIRRSDREYVDYVSALERGELVERIESGLLHDLARLPFTAAFSITSAAYRTTPTTSQRSSSNDMLFTMNAATSTAGIPPNAIPVAIRRSIAPIEM